MPSTFTSSLRSLALVGGLLALAGCAHSVASWVAQTRVHQGRLALARGDVRGAELSYRLALKIDPRDETVRAGYVAAAADLAHKQYTLGDLQGALGTIRQAERIEPKNLRLQALRAEIESASLKQSIVSSNYPTYRSAARRILEAYTQLDIANKAILRNLHRFSYTYDTADLTSAIKASYELELDVARNTNRLIAYRQLVSSGVPNAAGSSSSNLGGASLLPLP